MFSCNGTHGSRWTPEAQAKIKVSLVTSGLLRLQQVSLTPPLLPLVMVGTNFTHFNPDFAAYTVVLCCSDGSAWMSAGVAVTSSGATSGKRLSSAVRCFWNSTDAMMDRYASDSCQTHDHSTISRVKTIISGFLRRDVDLQRVSVPVVVLEDQSDGGDVGRPEHGLQAARRYAEVLLHKSEPAPLRIPTPTNVCKYRNG